MRLGWLSDLLQCHFSKCPGIEGLTLSLTGTRYLLASFSMIDFFKNAVSLGNFELLLAGENVAKLLILMPGKGIEPSRDLRPTGF